MKIWQYISAILSGVILGIIIAIKFLVGQDISIEVRKIKNKRISGKSDVTIPIKVQTSKSDRQMKRQHRKTVRAEKKLKKYNDRLNKKT